MITVIRALRWFPSTATIGALVDQLQKMGLQYLNLWTNNNIKKPPKLLESTCDLVKEHTLVSQQSVLVASQNEECWLTEESLLCLGSLINYCRDFDVLESGSGKR